MTNREAAIIAFKRLDTSKCVSERKLQEFLKEADLEYPGSLQFLSEQIAKGKEEQVIKSFYNYCKMVIDENPKVGELTDLSDSIRLKQAQNQ